MGFQNKRPAREKNHVFESKQHREKMQRVLGSKNSLLYSLYESQLSPFGSRGLSQRGVRSCLRDGFVESANTWSVYKTASPFNRRVTCIEWHPTYHYMVACCSHAGDILLWNFENTEKDKLIQGLGYGYGAITSMKFHPVNPSLIYTTAVDGRCCLQDFEGRHSEVYLDTMDYKFWWCSLDFSTEYEVIFVGDNIGNAVLLDLDTGQKICQYPHLHKGKIKHVEFCPARSWMFVTTSVDHTVALWDIRMMKSASESVMKKPAHISVMKHKGPISSAYFDPIYGSRLLTTALGPDSEIRVYDAHNWDEPSITVKHPHRNFQHMSDIKATWHPLYEDLCVVGRYPNKEDEDKTRCVDLIDLESGQRVGYLYSPHFAQIIQLNKFNRLGDCLVSGMGYTTLIWKPPRGAVEKTANYIRKRMRSGTNDSGGDRDTRRPKKRKLKGDKSDMTTGKKLKALSSKCYKKR